MSRTPRTPEDVTPEQIEAVKHVCAAVREAYLKTIEAMRPIISTIRDAYIAHLDEALCVFHDVENPPEGGWSWEERYGIARVLNAYDLTDAEYDARYGTDEESTR
ncbi:hypothetical protein [Brachybacterium sp. NPDC056505]|uniref:hypothetical protein n=1 Tax=Brachybacterium sp. NPDC056505 TaxID=3345843 RepID=UPI00367358F4